MTVHEKLVELLNTHHARYRLISHPHAGKSEEVAAIRGTTPGQGAKAMMCRIPGASKQLVLAVLPGNKRLDFKKLGAHFGAGKAQMADADLAREVSGCEIGAIPPFIFSEDIQLIVDKGLVSDNQELAFNAGRLDCSIVLVTEDFLRIAKPQLLDIAQI